MSDPTTAGISWTKRRTIKFCFKPSSKFDKFPQITYSNNVIVDITKRVTLLDRVSKNPYIFYPFKIESNERPDQLSNRYYNDPFKT